MNKSENNEHIINNDLYTIEKINNLDILDYYMDLLPITIFEYIECIS